MTKLEITDINELLVIESLLDKQSSVINRAHYRYYTVNNLLRRVHKTIKEAFDEESKPAHTEMFCQDCLQLQYPPCDKNMPCCKCETLDCNSRQPCSKEGGER